MKEIQIGKRVWTAENLALTTTKEGEELILGKDYFYPQNNKKNMTKYGLLYTWEAAMRVAPEGWHLPTDEEWTELEKYCSAHYSFGCNKKNIAKALVSTEGWKHSDIPFSVGNNPSANNKTGFSALPAGGCNGSSFSDVGNYANFWSATSYSSNNAYNRHFYYSNEYVYRNYNYKYYGFSVRLIKDDETEQEQPNKYKEYWKSLGHCNGVCVNEDGEQCLQCGDIIGGMTLWDEKKEKDFEKMMASIKDTLNVMSLMTYEDVEKILKKVQKIYNKEK